MLYSRGNPGKFTLLTKDGSTSTVASADLELQHHSSEDEGVTFSFSSLEGKGVPTAETILRYLARQTELTAPAVKPA
jgi:hypothetical protein